jgi:phosphonopyruvate decarboxylase
MIDPEELYECLYHSGVQFYTGVPDSLLKSFSSFLSETVDAGHHVIAANEGGAVSLAVGNFLATGAIPVVYLQNSGLGNTINPLLSLADPDVYSIPMLLIIGWRGKPGVKDEPQHITQGRIQPALLDTLEIPHRVVTAVMQDWADQVQLLLDVAIEQSRPVALVVEKGVLTAYPAGEKEPVTAWSSLSRETALEEIVACLESADIVVCTTGMASRELFEIRERRNEEHTQDFLTVGSMGHSSQIALGLALEKRGRHVICIDGDGAAIMHMGGLAIIGQQKPQRFLHIVLNNGAHDSVGGQPTAGITIDFPRVASACGYVRTERIDSLSPIRPLLAKLRATAGPTMLEIRVSKGARPDLGRPTRTTLQNRDDFVRHLREQ